MIDVTNVLRLEVETAPPAGKSKNLVKHYDGSLGGYFWVTVGTPAGSIRQAPISPYRLRYSHANGAPGFRSEPMPVVVGQYVTARFKVGMSSGTNTVVASIVFEDGNGTQVGTSGNSPAYTDSITTERTHGPFLVPANAQTARLVFAVSAMTAGQNLELADVAVICRASSAAPVWATDLADGPTWLDVLGPTIEVEVDRGALDLGLLSATIRDAALDPTVVDTIRPGRACRLSAKHGVTNTWEVMFEGEVTEFDVQYDAAALARRPGDPRHCKITLAACDRTRTLAGVRRPEGVATLMDLRDVLEGAGVPWDINGETGHTGVVPSVVSYNESASALDQVAITRDSNAAHAWLDRRGILQVWDRANLAAFTNTGFETDLAQWTANPGTITRVTTPTASGLGALQLVTTSIATHTLTTSKVRITPGHPYTVSVKTRAATTPRNARVTLNWRDKNNGNAGSQTGTLTANTVGSWTTHTVTAVPSVIPKDAKYVYATVVFTGITAVGETLYVDDLQGLGAEVVLDEATWTDIEIGGGSKSCINEVTVEFLRYVPASGTVTVDYTPPKSEPVLYGPYRDEASIRDYGVRPQKFTIHGGTEATVAPAFAAAVLAANARPKVSASSVTFPVKSSSDLVMTKALGDLQQTALVSFATKGYAEALRITGIKHSIKADAKHKARWIVTYTFDSTSTVAAPRSIPAVPSGNRLALGDTAWTAFPFAGGWANFDTPRTLQYRRENGWIKFRGIATAAAIGTIGTLGPGFRPKPRSGVAGIAEQHFPVAASAGFGLIGVEGNGAVVLLVGNPNWVDLSPVTYEAAQ